MVQLGNLENIGQLADLFHQLGYTRQLEQTDVNAWIVGRWRGFKITATISSQPERAAAKLARKTIASAQRSLAVALSPGKEVALAAPRIGVPGVTNPLSILLDAPEAFELHKLELLRPPPGTTALAHSLRVAEVLDSEPAGDRFFTAFRVVFERMILAKKEIPESDARALVLLCLIRILFLYFIQAKGWLDGRLDYMKSTFDAALHSGRHFHVDVLNRLFFGSLNVPPEKREQHNLGKIPYLNGGLFEPNAVEQQWPDFALSNEIWRDTFDELFERFQFCVSESSHVDSIAPDMLGRVFERMGEPNRDTTGTFYTPEVIVIRIVEAALETALIDRNGLNRQRARASVLGKCEKKDRAVVRKFLTNAKILDPAVGSGAFLLGALRVISRMWEGIDPQREPEQIRRDVIRRNLFGVDQSPTAVKLAELRLWLALIADDTTADIALIEPLPNFNGIIRQGDTLHDPLTPGSEVPVATSRANPVRDLRDSVFSARGETRTHQIDRLRVAERSLAQELLRDALKSNSAAIDELTEDVAGVDLFGNEKALTTEQGTRLKQLTRRNSELSKELQSINDGRIPFFSFSVHAPEVMERGGFDVVVGNPPWVRAERLTPELRQLLRERYSWWRGSQSNGYAHQPDLSVAFLERAFQLVAPGGAVGFLVPSKLLTSNYGAVARANLVRESTVRYLHRVPDRQANKFGATTYPLAVVAKRESTTRAPDVALGFSRARTIPHSLLRNGTPWLLLDSRHRSAMDSFLASGARLDEISAPQLGVKTGINRLLVGQLKSRHDGIVCLNLNDDIVEIEESMVAPALRGRDVKNFRAAPSVWLVWPYDAGGNLLHELPPLAARYLKSVRAHLSGRADYRSGPYWTLFRTKATKGPYAVVWADIARRPRAFVLVRENEPWIPLNSCYTARFHDPDRAYAAAAVLNSCWSHAAATALGDEARGGYRRINARLAGLIPIPTDAVHLDRLAAVSRRAHARRDFDADEVDEAVASALGLSRPVRKRLRAISNG